MKSFKFICGVVCPGASRVDKRCNNPVRSEGARCPKHQRRDVPVLRKASHQLQAITLSKQLRAIEEGTK